MSEQNAAESRASASGREQVEASVIELLPNATWRVELDNRAQVLAHAVGAMAANFVRVRVKDRVLVELSPHDRTRGRIVKLLRKG
jgi:translation initiation factor IF-1